MLAGILQSHGWHLLGTGVEAAVAEHPEKSYVLKIFNSDSAYKEFVKFVQDHAQNPHLPRFSRYVKRIPGTIFSYVRMEKLTPITKENLIGNYANYMLTLKQIDEKMDMEMLHWSLNHLVEDALARAGWDSTQAHTDYDHMYELLGGKPPTDWSSLVLQLATYAQNLGHKDWDLHTNNFLTRGNTLVIADPFF